jgi:hypothetical protein
MDVQNDLIFQPTDERDREILERSLHLFLAQAVRRGDAEDSSVFVHHDAPIGRWTLRFETRSALEAFRAQCPLRAAEVLVSSERAA